MTLRRRLAAFLLLLASACVLPAAETPDALRDLSRLRQTSNPARLEALEEILRERDLPYELQPFESRESPHGRKTGTNLVLTFGTGPREITVGAHYDAFEWKDGKISQGMVDNGAGAIALLHVAEALKGRSLRHRVRVVFFDKEEVDLGGSKAYVASRKPGEIAAAINLDIAGYGDSILYGLGKSAGDARLQEVMGSVCFEKRLSCMDFPRSPPGDNLSFSASGIPVVSIGLLPRLQAHQLWLYLNGGKDSGFPEGWEPAILKIVHTPEDTIEKVDPGALDLAAEVVLETLLRLDRE